MYTRDAAADERGVAGAGAVRAERALHDVPDALGAHVRHGDPEGPRVSVRHHAVSTSLPHTHSLYLSHTKPATPKPSKQDTTPHPFEPLEILLVNVTV